MRVGGPSLKCGKIRDVDYDSIIVSAQQRCSCLHEQEGPFQICGEDAIPIGFADFEEGCRFECGRTVHQDVEPAQLC